MNTMKHIIVLVLAGVLATGSMYAARKRRSRS